MQPAYVPKDPREKAMQRALMQYKDPKNYKLVHEALELAHREDLIGFGPQCLIRPRKGEPAEQKKPAQPQEKKPPQKEGRRQAARQSSRLTGTRPQKSPAAPQKKAPASKPAGQNRAAKPVRTRKARPGAAAFRRTCRKCPEKPPAGHARKAPEKARTPDFSGCGINAAYRLI